MARRGVYSLKILPAETLAGHTPDPDSKRMDFRAIVDEVVLAATYYISDPRDVPYFMESISDHLKVCEL